MLDDKENWHKKTTKRKSDIFIGDFFDKKRIRDTINEIDIPTLPKIDYSNSDTPIAHENIDKSSCLTEPFKTAVNLDCSKTPIKQIIPLIDFFKLPKPELIKSIEKPNESILDRSLTNSTASDTSLNDSFEILRSKLTRSNTYTPISFCTNNNTPETPCDLHDIDLDNMGAIKSLGDDSMCNVKFTMPRSISLFNKPSHISPIFYEYEINKREINKKVEKEQRHERPPIRAILSQEDYSIEQLNVELVYKIIDNDFTSNSYVYHIIDCRYPYEYDGGHINGAVNLYTPYQMLSYIFLSKYDIEELQMPLQDSKECLSKLIKEINGFQRPKSQWKDNAFIFHCEFSSIRGPEMARCLRNMDRLANWTNYPNLYFPKVYIMSKGYKEFFSKFKDVCKPPHYIKMDIIDPNREKGECMAGESDDEDVFNNSLELINEETIKQRLKMYNACKRETQEQMRLFSQLVNMESIDQDF